MARDPKTGRHWIWITPLLWLYYLMMTCIRLIQRGVGALRDWYLRIRYPELKHLQKQAGISHNPKQE